MNRNDILEAAFRAWGREGYKKMSLTDVAAELGVTKPALYRHFRDKELLFFAMRESFFDRYAALLKGASPSGFAGAAGNDDLLLKYVETIVRHFGGDRDDLAFLFGRVMSSADPEAMFRDSLTVRGLDVAAALGGTDEERMLMGNAISTGFFLVAMFHLGRSDSAVPPTEAELRALVDSARSVCARGLGFPPETSARTRYEELEKMARLDAAETAASDGLLPAVAAVVAEVGSWHASMDMVAKRSGLSKSGLYAHFKSKEDMLARLFRTEFERISAVLSDRCSRSSDPAERLYLAEASAANYLLARPDVLVALDWVRTQRLGLGDLTPESMDGAFAFLKEDTRAGRIAQLPGGFHATFRWILFLTVHQLMRREAGVIPAGFPYRRLRALHAFILSGIGAAGNDEKNAI